MKHAIRLAVLTFVLGTPLVAQEAARMLLDEFKKLHAAGKVLTVDVRSERDFLNGHIPGAINIPLGTEHRHVSKLRGEKRTIVTYCA
jgi:rhodanese-related sulfurtransferase